MFTEQSHARLYEHTNSRKTLLSHSCTAALEMTAILAGVGPGYEVIIPSYKFISTANALVFRDDTLVFVDIRVDTQNIDVRLIEASIAERTKAIVPVHYAGVGCETDTVMSIAKRHDLVVIQNAP